MILCYAECHYAERLHAESRCAVSRKFTERSQEVHMKSTRLYDVHEKIITGSYEVHLKFIEVDKKFN